MWHQGTRMRRRCTKSFNVPFLLILIIFLPRQHVCATHVACCWLSTKIVCTLYPCFNVTVTQLIIGTVIITALILSFVLDTPPLFMSIIIIIIIGIIIINPNKKGEEGITGCPQVRDARTQPLVSPWTIKVSSCIQIFCVYIIQYYLNFITLQ